MRSVLYVAYVLRNIIENGGINSTDPEVNELAARLSYRDREFGFYPASQ
jgi:hypothetical protein